MVLASVGEGPVAEGLGVIRVEPDGLVVVRNGAVVSALVVIGTAPVVEGFGVVRLDRQCRVVACERLVKAI